METRIGQRAGCYGPNAADKAFLAKRKPKISSSLCQELIFSRGKPESKDQGTYTHLNQRELIVYSGSPEYCLGIGVPLVFINYFLFNNNLNEAPV